MLRRAFGAVPLMTSLAAQLRYATVTPVLMPSLSPTMEHGKITEWLKKVGEEIKPGDTWCRLETDKATVAFDNASEEGFIARILADAGGPAITVGAPIVLLVENKADIDSADVKNWQPAAAAATTAPVTTTAAPVAAPAQASTPTPLVGAAAVGGRKFASPAARVAARGLNLDINAIPGTGGSVGRVVKDDVLSYTGPAAQTVVKQAAPVAAVSAAPVATPTTSAGFAPVSAAAFEDTPVSTMRAVIARRLTQSKNVEIPHYYEANECQADNMLQTIKHLNAKGDGKYKISVNDYIVKAVARANMLVPAANSHWHGEFIRQYKSVDVNVAVATPSGLITPFIRNVQAKGLAEISIEAKELAKRARDGLLQPAEYQGGTVTVSNLGGMGTQSFTAIINPPQSVILACGCAVPKPEIIKNEDGEFVMTGKIIQTIMFTASFDHRVVDGAVGAEWFKHFKDAIENPLSLLL